MAIPTAIPKQFPKQTNGTMKIRYNTKFAADQPGAALQGVQPNELFILTGGLPAPLNVMGAVQIYQ